jgi:hypothetical protein
MLEALRNLEFDSSLGDRSAGVVVLEADRLFGGDAQYFYVGRYKIENRILETEVVVQHYADVPFSIFGPSGIHKVILKGEVHIHVMKSQGHLVNDPRRTFSVKCVKKVYLP